MSETIPKPTAEDLAVDLVAEYAAALGPGDTYDPPHYDGIAAIRRAYHAEALLREFNRMRKESGHTVHSSATLRDYFQKRDAWEAKVSEYGTGDKGATGA